MTESSNQNSADNSSTQPPPIDIRRRVIFTALVFGGIALAATTLAGGVVATAQVLCVVFVGVLFGLVLARLARLITQVAPIPSWAALAVVLTLLIGIMVGGCWYFGAQVGNRVEKAVTKFDEVEGKLRDAINRSTALQSIVKSSPWSEQLLGSKDDASNPAEKSSKQTDTSANSSASNGADSSQANRGSGASTTASNPASRSNGSPLPSGSASGKLSSISPNSVASIVGGVFKSTLGLLTDLYIMLFVALFVAAEPQAYRQGLLHLAPPAARSRMGEILDQISDSLWHWFIGRAFAMLVTGILTSIGLALLGVPFPILLGVITGLMVFVPNIGGVIAGVLAFLFALTVGPTTALLVIPVYLGIQLVESNVITPLIQRQQIDAPPAILIGSQVLMGVLIGTWGVLVASPLLASFLVLHKTVYRHDILGEEVE